MRDAGQFGDVGHRRLADGSDHVVPHLIVESVLLAG
jgi:hypothetical protein